MINTEGASPEQRTCVGCSRKANVFLEEFSQYWNAHGYKERVFFFLKERFENLVDL